MLDAKDVKESSLNLKDIGNTILLTGNTAYNNYQSININVNNINTDKIEQQEELKNNSTLDLIYKSLKEIQDSKGDLSSILERILNELKKIKLASSSKNQYQIISEDKFSIFGEKKFDESKYNYFAKKNKKEIYNKIVLNGFFTIKSQNFKNKRKKSNFDRQEKNRYEFNNNKNEIKKEIKKQVKKNKSEIKMLKKEVNIMRKELSSKNNNNYNLYDYNNYTGSYKHLLYNNNFCRHDSKGNFIDRVKNITNELYNTMEIKKHKLNFYFKK
jgi:hypothetical protein